MVGDPRAKPDSLRELPPSPILFRAAGDGRAQEESACVLRDVWQKRNRAPSEPSNRRPGALPANKRFAADDLLTCSLFAMKVPFTIEMLLDR